MAMEITIETDLKSLPSTIDWNFEELKLELEERMMPYKGQVVDVNTKQQAKQDVANLRKLYTAINEKKKDVKKMCLKAYTPFENQCKELMGIVEDTANAIKAQVDGIDDAESKAKLEEIKSFFDSKVGDLKEHITFEQVLPEKWKNKTMPMSSIKETIETKLKNVRQYHDILERNYGYKPYWIAVENKLWATLDLGEATSYASSLEREETRKQEAEQAKAREAEELQKRETESVQAGEPLMRGKFEVEGTKEQIIQLREFMKASGIKFKIVK